MIKIRGVETWLKQKSKEDIKDDLDRDYEQILAEIEDGLHKYRDLIVFKQLHHSLVDALFVTIHTAISEADRLLEEQSQKNKVI